VVINQSLRLGVLSLVVWVCDPVPRSKVTPLRWVINSLLPIEESRVNRSLPLSTKIDLRERSRCFRGGELSGNDTLSSTLLASKENRHFPVLSSRREEPREVVAGFGSTAPAVHSRGR
jgi:hypothetical protein